MLKTLTEQKREYLQKLESYKTKIKKGVEWNKNISSTLFESRWAKIAALLLAALLLYELVHLLRPRKKSSKTSVSKILLEFVLKEIASMFIEIAKKKLRELTKK